MEASGQLLGHLIIGLEGSSSPKAQADLLSDASARSCSSASGPGGLPRLAQLRSLESGIHIPKVPGWRATE